MFHYISFTKLVGNVIYNTCSCILHIDGLNVYAGKHVIGIEYVKQTVQVFRILCKIYTEDRKVTVSLIVGTNNKSVSCR